jgi:alginate O-acetyltransferase complex protein AlgJ
MPTELHETPATPRWQAWSLIAVFTLLTLGLIGGSVQALREDEFTKTQANGWDRFWHGAPMRALADDLRGTPVADWLGTRQRELGWLLLKDLGPRVKPGCDEWLFLGDELTVHTSGASNAMRRADIAKTVSDALAARGTRVVITVVPDKTRVEGDRLCRLRRPAALDTRHVTWSTAMTARSLSSVALDEPLQEVKDRLGAAYDRTDTHWSPSGAKAAAEAIAAHLRAQGFTPSTEVDFTVTYAPVAPRWGDLVRLAGLDQLSPHLRPTPDQVALPKFDVHTPAAQATNADALFGDGAAVQRIALVGSSYSRNAHFADWLAQALRYEVGNMARDGGGFSQSMLDFLKQEARTDTPTAWLIWEIPERVLQDPIGVDDQALLKQSQVLPGRGHRFQN